MPACPVPVLVHGFLGFDRLGPITYFRDVAATLRRDGIEVVVPRVPPTGSIAERAAALAGILRAHPAPCFALLGHSMGGLDARYLASRLDPDRRVSTVVTVSTPHRGSPVAERVRGAGGIVSSVARRFLDNALRDLCPDTRLAEPIPDRPDVRYVSYATVRVQDEIPLLLRPFARLIDGPNDGLVPVSSAAWGELRGTVRSDHLEVVGWSMGLPNSRTARPFDHRTFWRDVVRGAMLEGLSGRES